MCVVLYLCRTERRRRRRCLFVSKWNGIAQSMDDGDDEAIMACSGVAESVAKLCRDVDYLVYIHSLGLAYLFDDSSIK